MIQLTVELEDLTDDVGYQKIVIPCDLYSVLNTQHEYVVVSCEPEIHLGQYDDIQKLNNVLDEINSENPEMTACYLGVLLQASRKGDIFDPEFLQRIENNDFMFEDLTDITWRMEQDEIAARYLTQELKIPFDREMSDETFQSLTKEELTDYVNWKDVWKQYAAMGFQLIGDSEHQAEKYLIYWR